MAAKTADPQALALEALTQALLDPVPKVLLGSAASPGFFKGSTQPIKAAAKLCEERGWVAGTGEWVGKGKIQKQKFKLAPAGVQAVLGHSEGTVVLRSLTDALKQQVEQFRSLQDLLGSLLSHIQPLTEVVDRQVKRLQPPDVEQILRNLKDSSASPPAPPPKEASATATDWLNLVVNLVAAQYQKDRLQPLTFPQVYAAIRNTHPSLTLGQFHDGLRALREQRRIRLSPFTRALATMPDPRNALFLDGEVKYYVETP